MSKSLYVPRHIRRLPGQSSPTPAHFPTDNVLSNCCSNALLTFRLPSYLLWHRLPKVGGYHPP